MVAVVLLPILAPFAAAAPTSFTINVVEARSLGCSPDSWSSPDLRVRVLVDGAVVGTTEKAQDRDEPIFGFTVSASAQLPATIGIEVEEAEPGGFFGTGTTWIPCSVASGGATRATFSFDGAPSFAFTARGDGEQAAEATVVVGTAPPAVPTLTVANVDNDQVTLSWSTDATGRATADRVAVGTFGAVYGTAAGTSATISGLCDNVPLTFRLIRDATSWHVASADVTVTTTNLAPGAATVLNASRDGNVSFETPTTHDVARYEVHASASAPFTPTNATLRHTIAPFVALSPRQYAAGIAFRSSDAYVRIVTVDTAGASAASTSFAFGAPVQAARILASERCGAGTFGAGAPAPGPTYLPEPTVIAPPTREAISPSRPPTPTPYSGDSASGPVIPTDESGSYSGSADATFEFKVKAPINISEGGREILNVTRGETVSFEVVLMDKGNYPIRVFAEPVSAFHNDTDMEMFVHAEGWTGGLAQRDVLLQPYTKATLWWNVTVPAEAPLGDLVALTQIFYANMTLEGGWSNTSRGFHVRVRVVEGAPAASWDTTAQVNGSAGVDAGVGGSGTGASSTAGAQVSLNAALVAGSIAGAGGLAALALWLRRDASRFAMAALMYSRLAKSDMLHHPGREAIRAHIEAEPGICYSELKAAMQMNTGAIVHHLRALERTSIITSRKEGAFRRFYLVGLAPMAARSVPVVQTVPALTPTQERVLRELADAPLTQGELAARMGLTQQGVNYHVKAMERAGIIEAVHDGKAWRYSAKAAVEA